VQTQFEAIPTRTVLAKLKLLWSQIIIAESVLVHARKEQFFQPIGPCPRVRTENAMNQTYRTPGAGDRLIGRSSRALAAAIGDGHPLQVKLGRGQVWASDEPAGRIVTCLFGSTWVTREGDADDFVLEPLMRVTLPRSGRVVVEGLEASVIEVR
jgi:hypothetical protein